MNLRNLQSAYTVIVSDNQGVGIITDNDAAVHDDNINTNEDTSIKIFVRPDDTE